MDRKSEPDTGAILAALERAGGARIPDRRPPQPPDALRGFIKSAWTAGETYAALAKTIGQMGRALATLAREELDTERRLQAEYLARTGDTLALPPNPPRRGSALGALTYARMAELENAEKYDAAAGSFPELAELFTGLAARERQHALVLGQLLHRAVE